MIYCIWYPSGGFGHFVNAVISLHGKNFVRPDNQLTFSSSGNSHSLELAAPKYYMDRDYTFNFVADKNYSVLVDNGINNEGTKFIETFPGAKIIKLCYTDFSWPVVAHTMIVKAMHSSFTYQLKHSAWQSDEKWAQREKYFLFLRDHPLRYKWRDYSNATNINIETLLNYDEFNAMLSPSSIDLENFKTVWDDWNEKNYQYFAPIIAAQDIIKQIKDKSCVDLLSITDVWTQAVIYYYIWLAFKVEIPHNDYANFFSNTKEIIDYLEKDACV